MRKMSIAGLLAMGLAACATSPGGGGAPGENRVTYACEGGPDLTVIYAENVARVVQPDGSLLDLPQQVSGSGVAYGTATHSIRGKGNELTYTVGRMVPRQCRAR